MGSRSLGLIRLAEQSDCEALASIYQQSLDARDCSMEVHTDSLHFSNLVARLGEREAMLVLEDEGVVFGWGVVKYYSDRVGYRVACETSIYFDRQNTGRGYGTQLQRALIEKAREFGYHHIVAKIWASNSGSLRFHEKFGYEMVGIQKEVGYLDGQWRDVAILQCLLPDVRPDETTSGNQSDAVGFQTS